MFEIENQQLTNQLANAKQLWDKLANLLSNFRQTWKNELLGRKKNRKLNLVSTFGVLIATQHVWRIILIPSGWRSVGQLWICGKSVIFDEIHGPMLFCLRYLHLHFSSFDWLSWIFEHLVNCQVNFSISGGFYTALASS